jgi:CRP-like cAMP-binding protein
MTFLAGAEQISSPPVDQPRHLKSPETGYRQPFRAATQVQVADQTNLPLAMKLQRFVNLGPEEIAAVLALSGTPKACSPEQILVYQGEQPADIALVSTGLAIRFKMLSDGRRQVIAYVLPGGMCEANVPPGQNSDHFIATLCPSTVIMFAAEAIVEIKRRYPRIALAFAHAKYRDEAILREWILNIGQRNAVQRISHFFCEMAIRLRDIGLVNADGSFELPINQAALADTSGLTPVHVNRILQRLRKQGLIAFRQGRLQILDAEQLASLAWFDGSYLRIATGQP